MLGQLPLVALFGPRFDLRPGFGDFLQPLLAARQFIWNGHPIWEVRLIRSLSLRHQFRHLGLQSR